MSNGDGFERLVGVIEYADEHAAERGAYDPTCESCVCVRDEARAVAKVVWNEGYRLVTPPGDPT